MNAFTKGWRFLAAAVIAAFFGIPAASAKPDSGGRPMIYTYNAPETELDDRYTYQWTVLKTALERTAAKYGSYVLAPSKPMSEKRQIYSLTNQTGDLSVMYLGVAPEFESKLLPIPIPIDKDLEGYCVFLINKANTQQFTKIRTADDLHRFSFGLGYGWIDVDILKANDLKVQTGTSYEGLFRMLQQGRFDIFLRSSVEVLHEIDVRKAALPELSIEPTITLHYPMPMYFWFAKTDEGRRLAARAEEGLWSMVNDGTFDALFEKFQRDKIDRLDLKHRRIIQIKNPYFSAPKPPYNDARLWFDPHSAAR